MLSLKREEGSREEGSRLHSSRMHENVTALLVEPTAGVLEGLSRMKTRPLASPPPKKEKVVKKKS